MFPKLAVLVGLLTAVAARRAVDSDNLLDESKFAGSRCNAYVARDVAVIGGGASGSYSAVQLREIYNKSVVLIEIKDFLGGHVATYVDPNTSSIINYGIMTYDDYGNSKKFMEQMNVTTQERIAYAVNPTTVYVDPYTGKEIQNYTGPTWPQVFAAMGKLDGIIKQYDNYLVPGYWNFPAGKDIPADLLMPWSEFVAKYGLQDLFWILKIIAGPDGRADQPTMFILFNFNTIVIEGFFNNSAFDPKPFDMRVLYENVRNYLGKDALVSTKVIQTKRTEEGVTLVAQGHDGRKTCICAKKLLIAAQPSLKNLEKLDLDKEEKAVFGTWATVPNFAFVIRSNFIPDDRQVQYMSSKPEDLPFNLNIEHTVTPGLFRAVFNSQFQYYSLASAKATVSKYFQNMINAKLFNTTTSKPTFKIVSEADFTSVQYNQSVDAIKAGFMHRLYDLQGKRSTWYTGGLWSSDYTANVWAFTDTVLPKLVNQK